MNYLVRTVSAFQLRIGDTVIPDHGPRQHVTMHRIQGAHPVVAVQFAETPGATTLFPPNLPILIEETRPEATATHPGSRP